MPRVLLSFVLFALLAPPLCLARDIALIVGKSNPSSAVSNKDLVKLLKNENAKWPDGKKVTVYLSNPSSEDGKVLLQKVYRMTPGELKSVAEGQKGSIVILASDEQVLKAVAEDPTAVGAVNVYSINSAIKVLKVDGKLPMEQGYLLHAN